MLLPESELDHFEDIVEYAVKIVKSTKGVKYYHFQKNYVLTSSVKMHLLIIGEAAKNISTETKDKLSNIPWKKMTGLRNKLAHDYGEMLTEIIWLTAQNSIPELLNELDKIDELKDYIKQAMEMY